MAQAPQGPSGGGAPRQNKTVKEFTGMNTQNERNAIPVGAFHWLENIQPIGPGHLHSIPGRSASIVKIPPDLPPPPGCTDASSRGQQNITIELAFDQATTFGGGNLRTSWAKIADGELYSMIGQAGCAGGNMAYSAVCVQINHYTGDNSALASGDPPSDPDPAAAMINSLIGTSDVSVWGASDNGFGGVRIYYDLGNSHVDYALPSANFGGHGASTFAIEGDEVWFAIGCCLDSGPPSTELTVCDKLSGVALHHYNSWGTEIIDVQNMALTANFCYVLGNDRNTGVQTLFKINRSTGVIADRLTTTALLGNFIAVSTDNLIYLLCNGTPAKVYYVENFTDMIYVGYTPLLGFSQFAHGSAIWNDGKIYYGSSGFAGFSTNVNKITIACPSSGGPILAAVTTDPTVVAGASIAVNWSDILVPAVSDTILIKPAPAAGVHGLVGATVASFTNSLALDAGTTSIAIPGGTTPGNYVAMYAARGDIWAATSAVFTVT